MKKSILITSSALTLTMAVLSTDGFSQNNYGGGKYHQPDDQRYNQVLQPSSPTIIMNGEGRGGGYQNNFGNYNGRAFGQCFEDRNISRRQGRRLEKLFGFIPPLVLYVPDRFVIRTGRNETFFYKNGIAYNRGRDGYFHLDDRYFRDDFDNRNNYKDWSYNNRNNDRFHF